MGFAGLEGGERFWGTLPAIVPMTVSVGVIERDALLGRLVLE